MAASRESMPFTMGIHLYNQALAHSQNMQLSSGADGTALYNPMRSASPPSQYQSNSTGGGANPVVNMNIPVTMNGSERVKKRRGRPRKYGPENGGMSLDVVPGAPSLTVVQSSGDSGGETLPTLKKMRGRPLGSTNKHKLQTLGSKGVGFTPYVLTVRTGEDVISKIMTFSQNGPNTVCVLSANGAVSNVTLSQAATSGGTVSYEGRFEILSLSGSFLLLENNGHRSRTGGLSVSLSGPDGNVLGGCVAGLLIAASPVQIVVGSFIPEEQKETSHVSQMKPMSPTLPYVATL